MEKQVFALDSARFSKAIAAGAGQAIFKKLSEEEGISFSQSDEMKWLDPRVNKRNFRMALDIQAELALTTSSGIPAYLATYFDPALIPVLVSPMMAAEIAGE